MNPDNHSGRDVSAKIARLFVYPVKSCAGVELSHARLTVTGLEWDRRFMVVDAQGRFVTQREYPRLALVRPQIADDGLILSAPGMPALHVPIDADSMPVTVKVWEDEVAAFDVGDEAACWFSGFLCGDMNQSVVTCRLVRFDPSCRRASSLQWTAGVEALNQFSDGFPLLVLSEASQENLNERLAAAGHAGVCIERFRPNVVLSGLQAHDEDRLSVMHVDAGHNEILLKPVKPCPRCPIPDIDPLTARIGTGVGDTLLCYRQDDRLAGAVTFGMNTIVLSGVGSTLRVGQAVSADFDFA